MVKTPFSGVVVRAVMGSFDLFGLRLTSLKMTGYLGAGVRKQKGRISARAWLCSGWLDRLGYRAGLWGRAMVTALCGLVMRV